MSLTDPTATASLADADLSGRRRSFVARPRPAPAPLDEEDFPVLTEIVELPAETPSAPPPAAETVPDPAWIKALQTEMAHDLAQTLEHRLLVELPSLVAATLESALSALEADLKHGIAAATEAAVKDFLARRAAGADTPVSPEPRITPADPV